MIQLQAEMSPDTLGNLGRLQQLTKYVKVDPQPTDKSISPYHAMIDGTLFARKQPLGIIGDRIALKEPINLFANSVNDDMTVNYPFSGVSIDIGPLSGYVLDGDLESYYEFLDKARKVADYKTLWVPAEDCPIWACRYYMTVQEVKLIEVQGIWYWWYTFDRGDFWKLRDQISSMERREP